MREEEIYLKTDRWVREKFLNDSSGHDYWHVIRVVKLAENIAKKENGNVLVCKVAAYLHDVADEKLVENVDKANQEIGDFLNKLKLELDTVNSIWKAMKDVSFKGNHKTPETLEGKIVQDADRLDAIGAIGIARTFAYGGHNGHRMYDPHIENTAFNYRDPRNTSIQHFYDKLLKLKDLMNTKSAKELANNRHQFMENFLEQFFMEWKGTDYK